MPNQERPEGKKESAGQMRKSIYERVQEIIGRELKEKEHKKIKETIQAYAKEYGETLAAKQIEHTYICGQCGGRKHGKGRPFSHKMNQNYKKA